MAKIAEYGIGLGLQAETKAPAQIFAAEQQQDLYRKKRALAADAQQEKLYQKNLKDLRIDPNKYHRLVKDKVAEVSNMAVEDLQKLKSSGDPNWYNQVYTIENDFRNKIAHLGGLSDQYKSYEKQYGVLGNYKTKGQESIRNLMEESTDYEQMLEKARKRGIGGIDVDSGLITDNTFVRYMDVDNELDKDYRQIKGVLEGTTPRTIKTKDGQVTIEDRSYLVPRTIAEAREYASKEGYVPASLESVAISKLQDPRFRRIFADSQNIDPNDYDALVNAAMKMGEEFVTRNIKSSKVSADSVFNVTFGKEEEKKIADPSFVTQKYTTGRSKTTPGKYEEVETYAQLGMEVDGITITGSSNLVESTTMNKASITSVANQTLKDVKINLSGVFKDQKGNMVHRPYRDGIDELKKIDGVDVFAYVGDAATTYIKPTSQFAITQAAEKAKDARQRLELGIQKMQYVSEKINQKFKSASKDLNSELNKAIKANDYEKIEQIVDQYKEQSLKELGYK